MHTDNPAGRLLHILQEGKDNAPHNTCKDVWFQLLEVENENFALLMSRLGKVMGLPEQIRSQIQYYYPNQNDTCKHWINQVNLAFSTQTLDGSWEGFNQYIDEHTINYLSMSVDLLDTKENTQILKEDKLSEIREKINDLLTDILKVYGRLFKKNNCSHRRIQNIWCNINSGIYRTSTWACSY